MKPFFSVIPLRFECRLYILYVPLKFECGLYILYYL